MGSNARRSRHALPNARRSDETRDLRASLPRGRADGRGADGSGRDLATGRLEASSVAETGGPGARPPSRPPDALSRRGARLKLAHRLDERDEGLLAKPVRRPRRFAQKDGPMTERPTTGSKDKAGTPASQLIDARIKELNDRRGETLSRVRSLIKDADPEVVEEWKWRGVPVWSHAGILCTGETYKAAVKLTFAKGAALDDPSGLFNSSLEGSTRRAIDIHQADPINERAFKALVRAAIALNESKAKK